MTAKRTLIIIISLLLLLGMTTTVLGANEKCPQGIKTIASLGSWTGSWDRDASDKSKTCEPQGLDYEHPERHPVCIGWFLTSFESEGKVYMYRGCRNEDEQNFRQDPDGGNPHGAAGARSSVINNAGGGGKEENDCHFVIDGNEKKLMLFCEFEPGSTPKDEDSVLATCIDAFKKNVPVLKKDNDKFKQIKWLTCRGALVPDKESVVGPGGGGEDTTPNGPNKSAGSVIGARMMMMTFAFVFSIIGVFYWRDA